MGWSFGDRRATVIKFASGIAFGRSQRQLEEEMRALTEEGHSIRAIGLNTVDVAFNAVFNAATEVGGINWLFHSAGIGSIPWGDSG